MKITKNEMKSLEAGTIIYGNSGIYELETDYEKMQDGYLKHEININEDGNIEQVGNSGWITADELLDYKI